MEPEAAVLDRPAVRRAMNMIIMAQCSGMLSMLAFRNNQLLAYFKNLGISSTHVMYLTSLPYLTIMIISIAAAWASDRYGKKRIGYIGQAMNIAGFAMIASSGFFVEQGRITNAGMAMIVAGIAVFSLGYAFFTSNWFALLKPILPEEERGRFFGRMRSSWQVTALVFTLIVARLLEQSQSIGMYMGILVFVTVMLGVRIIFYRQIPELEKNPEQIPLRTALTEVLRAPGYLPYLAYVFLIGVFTMGAPALLGLLAKDVLAFTDKQVVTMGFWSQAGMIAGFFTGGKMVDRFGTKPVFLIVHFGFAAVLWAMLARPWSPIPLFYMVSIVMVLFGFFSGGSSIAITSETMGLMPKRNASVAVGVMLTLSMGGWALAGFVNGKIMAMKVLAEKWELFGQQMTAYDSLLLGNGMMILIMVVTLGLIPSVVADRKAQWMPR